MIELKCKEDVKKFTHEVFEEIKKKKTCKELEEMINSNETLNNSRLSIDKYPPIKFSITPEEIETLRKNKIIEEEGGLSKKLSSEIEGTLAKLLYAMAWKNGDLPKLKHIINGILDSEKDSDEQKKALVFHQFGRHLANSNEEPIIDQHVLGAFAIYRELENTPKEQKKLIVAYKEWFSSSEIEQELKMEKDYMYYIDQILFATGKAIKNVKD
jgi:hypothetical protein